MQVTLKDGVLTLTARSPKEITKVVNWLYESETPVQSKEVAVPITKKPVQKKAHRYACRACSASFKTSRGRGIHEGRQHGIRGKGHKYYDQAKLERRGIPGVIPNSANNIYQPAAPGTNFLGR